jgi:hypothetical protein
MPDNIPMSRPGTFGTSGNTSCYAVAPQTRQPSPV